MPIAGTLEHFILFVAYYPEFIRIMCQGAESLATRIRAKRFTVALQLDCLGYEMRRFVNTLPQSIALPRGCERVVFVILPRQNFWDNLPRGADPKDHKVEEHWSPDNADERDPLGVICSLIMSLLASSTVDVEIVSLPAAGVRRHLIDKRQEAEKAAHARDDDMYQCNSRYERWRRRELKYAFEVYTALIAAIGPDEAREPGAEHDVHDGQADEEDTQAIGPLFADRITFTDFGQYLRSDDSRDTFTEHDRGILRDYISRDVAYRAHYFRSRGYLVERRCGAISDVGAEHGGEVSDLEDTSAVGTEDEQDEEDNHGHRSGNELEPHEHEPDYYTDWLVPFNPSPEPEWDDPNLPWVPPWIPVWDHYE